MVKVSADVYMCGGTLVASKYFAKLLPFLTLTLMTRYIVTAAHCLYFDVANTQPMGPSDVKVTLGEHNR